MASVFRRDRSKYWWAAVTLPNGKRRQFSTKMEDEDSALELAQRTEREMKRQRGEAHLRKALSGLVSDLVGASQIDASTWLCEWLKRRTAEVEAGTSSGYKTAIDEFAVFLSEIGRLTLADITVNDVVVIRDRWSAVNSPATTILKLKVVKMALKDAWRSRLVSENVADFVESVRREKGTKRRNFRPDELRLVLEHCDATWRAMVLLALYSGGQRMGDLASLRWRNVDLAKGMITTQAEKTRASIILPIVSALSEALEELPSSDDPEAFLFPEIQALTKAGRSKRFRRILYEAGLVSKRQDHKNKGKGRASGRRTVSELTFHSMRHTATTMLKVAGVSDAVARSIVGHESASISKNYTHMPLETMREALEKLKV